MRANTVAALDPERKYTRIRGVVYDVTDFASRHPGGAQLLSLCVGRDATILVESHHLRPEVVQKYLKTLPVVEGAAGAFGPCLLYTSPSPRDQRGSRMPSSA